MHRDYEEYLQSQINHIDTERKYLLNLALTKSGAIPVDRVPEQPIEVKPRRSFKDIVRELEIKHSGEPTREEKKAELEREIEQLEKDINATQVTETGN